MAPSPCILAWNWHTAAEWLCDVNRLEIWVVLWHKHCNLCAWTTKGEKTLETNGCYSCHFVCHGAFVRPMNNSRRHEQIAFDSYKCRTILLPWSKSVCVVGTEKTRQIFNFSWFIAVVSCPRLVFLQTKAAKVRVVGRKYLGFFCTIICARLPCGLQIRAKVRKCNERWNDAQILSESWKSWPEVSYMGCSSHLKL